MMRQLGKTYRLRYESTSPTATTVRHGRSSGAATELQAHAGIAPVTERSPSLPGYGFSDKPRQPGHATKQMAAIFVKLMARLGYMRYGTQGGDWGGPITTEMATTDAAHVVGLHLNQCSGNAPAGVADPTVGLPPIELARMRERQAFWTEEQRGYSIVQGTRAQTLGFALNDSSLL